MLTRSARSGLLSPAAILCRRFDARGAIEIDMGLPESSVRGFWIAWAGLAVEASAVVARVRRGMRCACPRTDGRVKIGLGALKADGTRKSRYNSCEVAPEVALLYALEAR